MLVSLPASELRNVQITESLFELNVCRTDTFSTQMRSALNIVDECVRADAPKLVVARPEMFTEGMTLKWLNDHACGVKDHLCFSDGSTIRLIPGFRNHVFFFGLGAAKHVDALARLERRVPEIFTQISSQFNTAIKFRWREKDVTPQTYAAIPLVENAEKSGDFRRLIVNRHSVQDSIARMTESPGVHVNFSQFKTLTYIRITENGFCDEQISKSILSLVADSLVNQTQSIIFVLPDATKTDGAFAARLLVLVEGLFAGGGRLPNVVAPNVFITGADVSTHALGAMACVKRLVVDDFADFWRSPSDFYQNFEGITVYARSGRHIPDQLDELMQIAYGQNVSIKWLKTRADVVKR